MVTPKKIALPTPWQTEGYPIQLLQEPPCAQHIWKPRPQRWLVWWHWHSWETLRTINNAYGSQGASKASAISGFFRTKSYSWHAESKTSWTNRGLRMSLTWSTGTVWGSSLSLSSLCPLSKCHWSIPLYFHGQSPAPAPCHVTPESSPLPHMGKSSPRAKHGIYIFKWLGLREGTSKEDNFMTHKNYVTCKLQGP